MVSVQQRTTVVCRTYLHYLDVLDYPSPALRQQISICQTTHHHNHRHAPALAWNVPGKTPHLHVVWAFLFTASGKPPAGTFSGTLSILELQLRAGSRANATCVHLQPVLAQIAICEIADPHPPLMGKAHTRQPYPPGYARASGQTICCGPAPSSQAGCLFISERTHTHTLTHIHAGSTSPPHDELVYVIWELPNYFCTAQASNQATRRGVVLDFSSCFSDPLGGCPTIACGCDAARSGEPPSVCNDDGSTRAWHGSVNRVAEKEEALLNSGSAVWIWQTTLSLPSRPGSGLLPVPPSSLQRPAWTGRREGGKLSHAVTESLHSTG